MARSSNASSLRNHQAFDLAQPQQTKLTALRQFRELLNQAELQDATKRDGVLFSTLLNLAFNSYGVQQAKLTEMLDLSAGVLGRWAKGTNLPSAPLRPVVIRTLVEVIDPSLAEQETMELPTGIVH